MDTLFWFAEGSQCTHVSLVLHNVPMFPGSVAMSCTQIPVPGKCSWWGTATSIPSMSSTPAIQGKGLVWERTLFKLVRREYLFNLISHDKVIKQCLQQMWDFIWIPDGLHEVESAIVTTSYTLGQGWAHFLAQEPFLLKDNLRESIKSQLILRAREIDQCITHVYR